MSILTLKLFATLRERAGANELVREFPDGITVGDIWQRLASEFPALQGHRESVAFAVNHEYVESDYRPRDRDEVAFIPPVSGGATGVTGQIRIVTKAIDIGALEQSVADPGAGATVTFAGTTRNNNVGRRVIRLQYEAYEPMALSEMHKLADLACQRFEITRIAITHRIGTVEVGEISVAIAVSAPHRGAAFDACRFAIDRLKEIVPIWKKEYFEGGEVWVGCQTSHPPADH